MEAGTVLPELGMMDVSKSLVRGTKSINPLGEHYWITFKYERVQNYYYWCGLLDHMVADCEEKPEQTSVDEWPYGPGLWATPRKRMLIRGRNDVGTQNFYADKGSPSETTVDLNSNLRVRHNLNMDDEEIGAEVTQVENLVMNQVQGVNSGVEQPTNQENMARSEGFIEVNVEQAMYSTNMITKLVVINHETERNMEQTKHGKKHSWIRTKCQREKEGSSCQVEKNAPTKRLIGEVQEGLGTDNFFSKKAKDGLSVQFDQFEISAETARQSRRMQ
ncbi:uncharacterized protein LOC126671815 isoform X2 [Mercurialis annua]|uniref:uncharacterized protein LOC126671815 isoform X2 n=1 Tax=Mercurialis annua TaxID=3986 RepID=UPI00215FC7EE|nr:uncharacterized protein LOC126671815 isoform X2 [Mercurialis annua]